MDFELRRAQQRYEKEQREKREKARVKAERERKAKEEIEARRRAIEEAQRIKRLEEAAAAEAARLQLDADLQAGGGIRFNRELVPVAIAGDRDKITLPQSVLSDLPLNEALDRGPMLFELSVPCAAGGSTIGGRAAGGSMLGGSGRGGGAEHSAGERGMEVDGEEEDDDADEGDYAVDVHLNGGDSNGRRVKRRVTHGGVLEFTAPEGCVGLPPLILRNLGLSGIIDVFNSTTSPPPVRVRFVRLPKATFARLQPLRHGFLADVANHRAVLEAALRGQAALTRGDVLLVGSEVGEVAVRVCEVKGVGGASGAATVIDADVEVEAGKGRKLREEERGEEREEGAEDGSTSGGLGRFGEGRGGEEGGVGTGGEGGVKREVIHVGSADRRLVVLPIGGKGVSGEIKEGEWRYFKVYVDGRLARRLYLGEVELAFQLKVERGAAELDADVARGGDDVAEGDADLYLSRHPIVYPSFLDHDVASILPIGSKTLSLSASTLSETAAASAAGAAAATAPAAREAATVLVPAAAAAAAAAEELKDPATYTIAVHGAAGICRFNLSAQTKELISSDSAAAADQAMATNNAPAPGKEAISAGSAAASPPDQSRCGNCRQLIATRTLPLHEAYCSRHNVVCPHPGCDLVLRKTDLESGSHQHCQECGEVFGGRREREKHEQVRHGEIACECGFEGKASDVRHHRRTTCPRRPILCRFCAALVPSLGPPASSRDRLNGLCAHEAQCGARTAPCDTCKRPVMLKEMDVHVAAFHSPAATATAGPITMPATSAAAPPGGGRSMRAGTDMDEESNWQGFGSASDREQWGRAFAGGFAGGFGGEEGEIEGRVLEGVGDVGTTRGGSLGGDLERTGGAVSGRSMNVGCPICGVMVHSERDLNVHLDAAH
ncbi:hypothetical protein CLOP_g17928 [Closterium sp. NIES-67]|nr:hypothetical protein CLOP_g17928 [Closterium sp. NIES-67]